MLQIKRGRKIAKVVKPTKISQIINRVSILSVLLVVLQLVSFTLESANNSIITSLAASGAGAGDGAGVTIGKNSSSPFGLNIGAASRYDDPINHPEIPLGLAQGTGAAWDREEIRWDMVYRNNRWDWSYTDGVVSKAANYGFNLLVLLDYNADGSHSMPASLSDWAAYVHQVASHYLGQVHYYEIWNEPENPCYLTRRLVPNNCASSPQADPTDYANLLTTAYSTIKAIDPTAKVVTAGVNGLAAPWLEQVMQNGGDGHFDIIGVHPYVDHQNAPFSPDSRYWTNDQLAYWTALAARHGNKPLWATEFGWRTNQVSDDEQANYLAQGYIEGIAAGFQKLFVFVFKDPVNDQPFGIVRDWDATAAKPAYGVYKNLVAQLTSATFQQKVDLLDSGRQNIEDFDSSGGQLNWRVFEGDGITANVTLTSEQNHSGGSALRLNYQFPTQPTHGYAEISKLDNSLIPLTGTPTKIGLWVYGDNNSATFHVLLRDASGRNLKYSLGKAGTKGWHRLEAYLLGPQDGGDGSTNNLVYPLSFQSIQVYRQPDQLESNFGGTVYLDDFYAEGGQNVQDYRFTKSNGNTLDIFWSASGGQNISIPTQSATATLTDKFGNTSTVSANNGNLSLVADDNLKFVEHQAAPLSSNNGGGGTGSNSGNGNGNNGCSGTWKITNNLTPSDKIFTTEAFKNTWYKYDEPTDNGASKRTYTWGPYPNYAGTEPYLESPGGTRTVLYFDKSRMEITNPQADPTTLGYVTNGLLTQELITGNLQMGRDTFKQCSPADVPVAGDNDDTNGPTYAAFRSLLWADHLVKGATVIQTITANGTTDTNSAFAGLYGVTGEYYEPQSKHTIASVFWDFLSKNNQLIWTGPGNYDSRIGTLYDPYYYVPGLPITEAYWAKVKVSGQVKDVLIQAFQRRVLTYTPSNPIGFQVEWGNIGQHYYKWRYGN
jgi:hypothetical protein